jgi:hypothetical protein
VNAAIESLRPGWFVVGNASYNFIGHIGADVGLLRCLVPTDRSLRAGTSTYAVRCHHVVTALGKQRTGDTEQWLDRTKPLGIAEPAV